MLKKVHPLKNNLFAGFDRTIFGHALKQISNPCKETFIVSQHLIRKYRMEALVSVRKEEQLELSQSLPFFNPSFMLMSFRKL